MIFEEGVVLFGGERSLAIIGEPCADTAGCCERIGVAIALTMGFVFAGFASSTMTFAAETAFGLLVGVLADAFLVRMIIMPALLSLVRRGAWWIPRWLDKILPDLDTEGHGIDGAQKVAPTEPAREEGVLVNA